MEYSKTGLLLTVQFESCRLVAYQDSNGIWTCGWGHTFGVHAGTTCTQEQADAWLLEDVQSAVGSVNRLVTAPLTQNEFDAVVDFVFN
jgi:lysozyme